MRDGVGRTGVRFFGLWRNRLGLRGDVGSDGDFTSYRLTRTSDYVTFTTSENWSRFVYYIDLRTYLGHGLGLLCLEVEDILFRPPGAGHFASMAFRSNLQSFWTSSSRSSNHRSASLMKHVAAYWAIHLLSSCFP